MNRAHTSRSTDRRNAKRHAQPKNRAAYRTEDPRRVVIEGVSPQVDAGRFPIKRTVGEPLTVEADVYADGHEHVAAVLLVRKAGVPHWTEVNLKPLGNDRWNAEFTPTELGRYEYTLEAWLDPIATWQEDFRKRVEAGEDSAVDLLIGASLLESAATRAGKHDASWLIARATHFRQGEADSRKETLALALDSELLARAAAHADRSSATRYPVDLALVVDPPHARFSTWYELFPRSCSAEPGRHATFRDCETWLGYVASMGFDVLYLPPIHPIGRTFRKGRNNGPVAAPDDPGSPWAIGAEDGGHTSIHRELGTIEDFERFVAAASSHGLRIALDIAFQCSADHPYLREHRDWFRIRPDGTIQYAENPPKKYQDIYPLDFESRSRHALWEELKNVVLYWIDHGVHIFRVDNPHTKPFHFWEWLIDEVKRSHPEVVFLAEAFTRPKPMYRLAKLGFSQSYTYFTWRNTKSELTEYFTELSSAEIREFFRPNLWTNTPDILSEYLQAGGRPAFQTRLTLAATLGSSYGIYGPAFELCESQAVRRGSEEYLDSEKYEIKHRSVNQARSLSEYITQVNLARHQNPALQDNRHLQFHETDNASLICYSKRTEQFGNVVLVVVNLDFSHTQSGWVMLDLAALGIDRTQPFQVQDLLGGARYRWHGPRNYVELNPDVHPAHIFRVR
jgi:starch synthase (maltosyl-transferring)